MSMGETPTEITVVSKENYSVESFLAAYSISRNTFYKEVRSGNLEIFKYNYRTYITREAAQSWLKKVVESASKRILPSRRSRHPDQV